jgi:hypothetical protein
VAVWAAALISFSAAAQDTPSTLPLSAEMHPWGKFEAGAWKRIHLVTESYNEQGKLVSTDRTDSKTTLFDLDDDSLTLETQTCVEMAGKRFESEPQMVKQGFHGEAISPNSKIKDSAAGHVEIDDRKVPCQVLKLETINGANKTATTIYYSVSMAPSILKRESKTTDMEGKNVLSEMTTTLLSMEMPYSIDGKIRAVAQQKTVQKSPKGTVVMLTVLCPDIPGGIVSQSSKELDAGGRIVRRSILTLVDYGSEPENDRSGLFGRKRAKGHRSR